MRPTLVTVQAHSLASGGGHYIDSLAEVSNNTDPSVDNTADQKLYALQDQQFNVLALADATGAVVERYEYTLYGKREVHNAAYAVIGQSAYGVQFGFQGLYHDTESRLIYNRTRMLEPVTGRFISRDLRGGLYPDGMNTYAAYHVLYGGVDPSGMANTSIPSERLSQDGLPVDHNYLSPASFPNPEDFQLPHEANGPSLYDAEDPFGAASSAAIWDANTALYHARNEILKASFKEWEKHDEDVNSAMDRLRNMNPRCESEKRRLDKAIRKLEEYQERVKKNFNLVRLKWEDNTNHRWKLNERNREREDNGLSPIADHDIDIYAPFLHDLQKMEATVNQHIQNNPGAFGKWQQYMQIYTQEATDKLNEILRIRLNLPEVPDKIPGEDFVPKCPV